MGEAEQKFFARLQRCVERSDSQLKHFRSQRLRNIEAYCGPDYSPNTSNAKARPLNMVYQQLESVVPYIVNQNPGADISTYDDNLRYVAYSLERVLEWLMDEIHLAETFQRLFVDSFIGLGILKCGHDAGMARPFRHGTMAYRPYVDSVSLDNFVMDPDAMRRDECRFMGDKYFVDKDWAADTWPQLADKIAADDDTGKQDMARGLTRTGGQNESLYRQYRVADIWLSAPNPIGQGQAVIITVPAEGAMQPLEVIESDDQGPYETLSLSDVPDNSMPLAPITALAALDEMINAGGRKLQRQYEREKVLLTVERAGEADGKRVMNAPDGSVVIVDNNDRISERQFGGPSDKSYVYTQFLMEMFSRQGGNTNLVGGMATQSKTLGQDQILAENSGIRILAMQKRLYAVARNVMRRLGRNVMQDTGIDVVVESAVPEDLRQLAGIGPQRFNAQAREATGARFEDFIFGIEPYSMEPEDPKKRIENMLLLVNQVILPTMQASAAQGRMLDAAALVEMVGRELRIRELDKIYPPAAPQMMPQPAMPGGMPQPAGPRVNVNPRVAAGNGMPQMPGGMPRKMPQTQGAAA